MGLGLVPETRLVDGPIGPGSGQRFLDEDTGFDPRPMFRGIPDPRLWPVAVLDLVTNNADRKIGHLLRERGSERLWAIDNGLTFHPSDKLRTVLWGFAGDPIPPPLLVAVERLCAALDQGLAGRIQTLLGPEEADATRRRAARVLEEPFHPMPPSDRPPLPWPVW